jgi:hypothetical protein
MQDTINARNQGVRNSTCCVNIPVGLINGYDDSENDANIL